MPIQTVERFQGNLSDYRLPLVVPALYELVPASGTLRLTRAATERSFLIRRGNLIQEQSNLPKEHLGQVLANLKILDAERSAAAFDASQGAGVPLGVLLVDRGFVEKARVIEALAHKAREAFFDCYNWQAGEIDFMPGEPEPGPGIGLELPLGALHRDALARQREWGAFREIFPERDLVLEVFREWAAVFCSDEEDELLSLAERGASLSELLASSNDGPFFVARRILTLYRRGVLSPRLARGKRLGEAMELTALLDAARTFLSRGEFEAAAAIAAQAMERHPVPEAQALFREAEQKLGTVISDQVGALEGRLQFAPMPSPPPASLTADDFFIYARLKAARSIRQELRSAPMGERPAYQCVQRLLTAGVCSVSPDGGGGLPRRKTDPFGIRVIV